MPTLPRHGCFLLPHCPWLNEIWKLEDFYFLDSLVSWLGWQLMKMCPPQSCRMPKNMQAPKALLDPCFCGWALLTRLGSLPLNFESAASEFHGPSSTPNVKFVWAVLKSGKQVPWNAGEKNTSLCDVIWIDMIWYDVRYVLTKNLMLVCLLNHVPTICVCLCLCKSLLSEFQKVHSSENFQYQRCHDFYDSSEVA